MFTNKNPSDLDYERWMPEEPVHHIIAPGYLEASRWTAAFKEARRELEEEGLTAGLLLVVLHDDAAVLFAPNDERAEPIILRPDLTDGRDGSRLSTDFPTNAQLHAVLFHLAQELMTRV